MNSTLAQFSKPCTVENDVQTYKTKSGNVS